jgi:hypothetical protein
MEERHYTQKNVRFKRGDIHKYREIQKEIEKDAIIS